MNLMQEVSFLFRYRLIGKLSMFCGLFCFAVSLSAVEKAVPVRVATVKRMSLQRQIALSGEITAQRISNLSSRVDAMVVSVNVEEGDFVEKGDKLIQLDDELTRYDLKRSAAALEEAKAQLQESIRQRAEFSRLVNDKFIANTSFQAAEAKVRINQAVVKRLQAENQRYRELLSRHSIKAPFSGVVSEKLVEAGQWVKVGNTVLTLVDNRHLRIEAPVPQKYFSHLNSATAAEIVPDALPDQTIQTTVSRIVPVADSASRHFPVHIDFDNPSTALAPGMSARVILTPEAAGNQAVLAVPRDALIKQTDNTDSVWLVNRQQGDYRVQPVNVTIGQVVDNLVEIVSDSIAGGEQVVVRGNEILKPGQPVRIIP